MSPDKTTCPFCQLSPSDLSWSTRLVAAFLDRFPVSPGHTLLIPKRHVATWFEATREEQQALLDAVAAAKERLDRELERKPDGYNVGFNSGEAAGQTVMHLHVHVIPRYRGDHRADGRQIHLFVRPEAKVDFIYCGLIDYQRHVGEQPMRVWFQMRHALPRDVYRRWAGA